MLLNVYQRSNLFLVEGCLGNWLLCVIFGSTGICSHFLSIVPICIHIYQCHPHPLTPPQPTPLFRLPPGSTFLWVEGFQSRPTETFLGTGWTKTPALFHGDDLCHRKWYVYIRSVGLSVSTYGIQLYRGVNNLLVLDVPIKRFLTFSYAT